MFTRLENKLNKFQMQYQICGLDMFNDWIKDSIGFDSEKYYIGHTFNEKQAVYYKAEKVSLVDLHKLLAAFNIPVQNYHTGDVFDLSESLLFDELVPAFKWAITKLATEQPEFLKPYQIDSKPELEKEAIRKIDSTSKAIIKAVDAQTENDHVVIELLKISLCVQGILQQKSEKQELLIRLAKELLMDFLGKNSPIVSDELLSHASDLLNGFDSYETLNQVELRKIAAKLLPEVEAFSRNYKISESKSDFFEEMLMQMAGITDMPTHSSIGAVYNDKTRFEINVDNLKIEDAPRFLQLFKDNGDESAYTGDRRERHQLAAPDDGEVAQCARIEIGKSAKERRDKFNVDGVVLYQVIFPLFKAFVAHLAATDPSKLVKYQEASKGLFQGDTSNSADKLTKLTTQIPSALFQPPNPQTQPIYHGSDGVIFRMES